MPGTPDVVPAILAFVEIELTRNAVVWQLILAAGGLSAGFQPARRPERPPAGKIACTKRTYRRLAHLNFLGMRNSESDLVAADTSGNRPCKFVAPAKS